MTHDSRHEPLRRPANSVDIAARYADLLGPSAGTDPELAQLVTDLDAHYAAEAPAELASALDAAILLRVQTGAAEDSDALANTGLSRPSVSRIERRTSAFERGITMPSRRISTLVAPIAAVLVVGLLATVLFTMAHGGSGTRTSETGAQHFAQVGGLQVVIQVQNCPSSSPTVQVDCNVDAEIDMMMQAEVQRAADVLGVQDAVARRITDFSSGNQIEIDLPGYTDVTTAQLFFGGSDMLDVIDTGSTRLPVGTDVSQRLCPVGNPCPSNAYLVYFTSNQLDRSSISASVDAGSGQAIVSFAFDSATKQQFATYTAQHVGQFLTLTFNGIVIESATIQSEITGSGQITGLASLAEAQRLATVLKTGPLPLQATLLSVTLFGPNNSCATPMPGTPPVYPGTATPAPNATDTPAPGATWTPPAAPTPPPTPTPSPSGQSASFAPVYHAPVYSGGPGRSGTPEACGTPTVTPTPGGAPTSTIPPTPSRVVGTPTDTPPATPTPKP